MVSPLSTALNICLLGKSVVPCDHENNKFIVQVLEMSWENITWGKNPLRTIKNKKTLIVEEEE